MSDLISRKETLRAIDNLGEDFISYYKLLKLIWQFPSAEPERKKGEWIDEKINSYTSRTYCSECGSSAPFVYKSDDYYGNHAHGETAKTKFCPSCGAEMRSDHE